MQKVKVKCHLVHILEWKRTDRRTVGGDCITCRANVVEMTFRSQLLELLPIGVRPLLIIVVERDYLRGTIVWSHL